jgi:amino acid adenylation domain-containing protein
VSADAQQLLRELEAGGIDLDAVHGQLRVRAPRGALVAELRTRLQACKAELLTLLESRAAVVPLTGPQRQLWFVDHVEGSGSLQLVLCLRLRGALDRAALDVALEQLIDRHEALRTRIGQHEGAPFAVVLEDRSVSWSRGPTDPSLGRPFVASVEAIGPHEHELRLLVHHLVCDGWSMGVLLEDLGRLYSGVPLPELTVRPRDVARELDAQERSPEFEVRLEDWGMRLASVTAIDLPLDRRRPERASSASEGVITKRTLAPASWTAAVAHAQARQVTPFMLVAAAVAVVLVRWTRAANLCLGIPHANRGRAELAGVVAMLVDTLLLRIEIDPDEDQPFDELLERVRESVLATLEHADLPLDRVIARVHRMQAGRAPAAAPVPNVMLNFAAFAQPQPVFAGLGCELEASMPGSRFDLTIYAYPRGERLELEAAFRSELFEPETIAALLEQIATVLERVPTQSQRPWRTIALGGPLEVDVAMRDHPPYPGLVSTIAAWPGARTAVVGAGVSMSYAGLQEQAGGLAHAIARALEPDVGAERRVAIHARRSPATIVAILAVLAAGGAFVLLDASEPSARLLEMIELTRPRAWLALDGDPPGALVHALGEHARVRMPNDLGRPRFVYAGGEPKETYVAFTSGTSGRPRGVLGTLAPVEHFLAWYRDALEIAMHDRFAWLSGLAHDPSLRDIFGALCVGAQVYVPPREPIEMGMALGTWLAANAITVVHWTPSLARALAASLVAPLPALRRVCFGGDRLRGEDVRVWRRLAPNAELFNFYGTTETPQAIAVHRITDADIERPWVPIGQGIDGVRLELEGPAGPAAVGELGEIVVYTRHLAHGYLGEPELTRERFGDGLAYRTGDLGRRRHDGTIVCLGRLDDQTQIRGVRVELGEIEAILARLADTRVAVLARDTNDGERELVAWIAGGTATTMLELRDAAAVALPRAMLPTRWAAIAELPLTANAKLDRRALAQLDPDAHELLPNDATLDSALERALAGIWAELLGREHVGRHDDFFAIGGHSLLAVRLAVRIHEVLGVELPVWALFEQPTLAGCAMAIERQRVAGLPELRPRVHAVLPQASFTQARIWLLHQLDEDVPQPSIVHSLRLLHALDESALERALVELEQRHEILRTNFVLVEGRLRTRIAPARARVLEHGRPHGAARFDLEHGPVWRVHLWTNADGELRLELELHHICGEAGSMRILARDLLELYEAARDDRAPRLPALGCRYIDVAAWLLEWSDTPASQQALARWLTRLADVEPLELPYAPGRSSVRSTATGRALWAEIELEVEIEQGIERLAARESTTSFTVLLCALAAVLARWCGTTDVTIGAPVGLRPHPATRELIGPFLDLVALRLDASGDPSLVELLARARACVREAFADSLVPFEQILQGLYAFSTSPPPSWDPHGEAQPRPRTLDRTPVFQVLLNVVDVGETERLWSQLGAQRVIEREPTARYDLAVYAIRRPSSLRLAVLYDADRFEHAQGDALLEHLRQSLQGLLEHPQQRLSALALRRPHADRPPLSVHPRDELPFGRFVAVARANPEVVAIDMGTRTVSYAELLARVCAVADPLRGSRRIGLLVGEDEHMAAGMLAALALGITYVPLDPRLPPTRLRELIADAQPDALLCTASLAALAASLAEARPILQLDRMPESTALPIAIGHGDDLAYLLYTSGSTGRPKAVMQSQANLLHHALTYAERLEFGPGDRVSLVATHAFDAAVMDIYGALLSGATLCPIDLHGEALVDLAAELRERAITVFHATPTVVRHLLASLRTNTRLEAVRAVVLGGEEAHGQDAMAIAAAFGHPSASVLGSSVQIVNGLGPTECTLALQELVDRPPPPGSLAVGAPVPGVAVSLETSVGEQVALHGIGEIVLESPHLALGYWRRPRASERAFLQDEGRRRYRSGDLGQWLPGGRVGFVGRRGGFIKLRGHRIEPGEIEARLRVLPGVRAAAVVLREAELLGFYVAQEGVPVEAGELLRALANVLPNWMLPARLLRVDALPHTPTGKLDRRALALLPVPRVPDPGESPRSEAQEKILAVWSQVLGHTPARLDLDWFACGGDSLGAARLVRALERRLGLSVTLAEMFDACDIAQLARRLDGHGGDAPIMRARIRQLADGPGETWVFVLPPGARPELLAPLAAQLGRSLWAIQPPSFGETGPLPTIDSILDAITQALERDGPGPRSSFVLAGVSNGGLLACALAPSLPNVRALVMFDSLPPERLAERPWSERGEPALLGAFVHALCGATASFTEVPPEQRFTEALACVREHDPSIDAGDLQAMYTRYRSHGERAWQLLRGLDLRERGLPELVTLIEASDGRSQLAQRWHARLPNLRVQTMPGEHLDMFAAPHVEVLTQLLRGLGC